MENEVKNVSIKRGDTVVVIAGKSKGKKGKVISVCAETNSCVVDGVNVVIKHKKARSAQQKSSRDKKAGNIDLSNVMVLCKCGKPTRVSNKIVGGKKVRYCKKCDEVLDKKFKKVKEDKKDKEVEVKEGEEKKVDKKPLQRREIKSTADSKVKKPEKVSSNVSLPRKIGGS